MSKAIKIKLTKAPEEYDFGASKFFGDPTIPSEWAERFAEDIAFLGQIQLSDIAEYDKENRLPHKGYLYFFLDTECYPYDVWVEYYDGEPDMLLGDFNTEISEFEHLTKAYLMSFEDCDESEACTRLFGVPSSEYEPDEEHEGKLLLQFDPLDAATGFLEEVDGYAYIFYDTKKEPLDGATEFVIDRS